MRRGRVCVQVATDAAKSGARRVAKAGRRAADSAFGMVPGVRLFTWFGNRVVYVLFGMAFLYGLGNSLPGAVGRYLIERERRRFEDEEDEEERKGPPRRK